MSPSKVVIINFEAGTWVHSNVESRIGLELRKNGYDVNFFSCDGIFRGKCSVRSARQTGKIGIQLKKDCLDCKFTSGKVMAGPGSASSQNIWIGRYLNREAKAEAAQIAEIAANSDKPFEFRYQGLPLGAMASYEVILRYKLLDGRLPEVAKSDFSDQIYNLIIVLRSLTSWLAKENQNITFFIRNVHYSLHQLVARVAKSGGHRVIYFDGVPNISESNSHIIAWYWPEYGNKGRVKELFAKFDGQSSPASLARVNKHFHALRSSYSHKVYSEASKSLSADNIRKILNLNRERKTILVALSSTDEQIAAKTAFELGDDFYPGEVFKSQVEWIQQFIEWIRHREDLQAVIRVHPREFSTTRNKTTSPMVAVWEEVFRETPSNVCVNLPNQHLSIYDLFSVVDVVSTGWSTVGVEAAFEGIPVVTYDECLTDYPDFGGGGTSTKEQYFYNLDSAISRAKFPSTTRELASRWLHFQMNVGSLKISGRVLESIRYKLPRFCNLILEGLDRYLFWLYRPFDFWLTRRIPSDTDKLLALLKGVRKSTYDERG